jgi:large subunit ribosomal protein L22
MAIYRVYLKHLRIAPRKARLLASTLPGLTAAEAEAQLNLAPQRSAMPLLKLLKSAVSNAKNLQADLKTLVVKEARVDKGMKMARFWPRARGGVGKIEKKTCHVTLVLETKESKDPRFVFPVKVKKSELKKVVKTKKPKDTKEEKSEGKEGDKTLGDKKASNKAATPKIFNRKVI